MVSYKVSTWDYQFRQNVFGMILMHFFIILQWSKSFHNTLQVHKMINNQFDLIIRCVVNMILIQSQGYQMIIPFR